MNLHKRCRNYHCHEYFPAKPLELKFFCDKKECQEYFKNYHFYSLKSNRHLPANYFDLYDLDRPIKIRGKIVGYERVCRICGAPLFKKDYTYSHHKRYCNEHNGDALWAKYNWSYVSKDYATKIRDENQEIIDQKFKKIIEDAYKIHKEIPEWIKETDNLTICEECEKICQIYSLTYYHNILKLNTINIHHKIPVHKLTNDNFYLIWEFDNLIALCEDCHHSQDHQLKTKVDPYLNFRKITEFTS